MAAFIELEVQRNATFGRTLSFTDNEGAPLDLTGVTFDLGVKSAAGVSTGRIASAEITVVDAALGIVSLLIDGADFNAVPGPMEIVVLAYDLLAIQGETRMLLMRGPLILMPGVT